ncbi:MAG: hypothetical protein MUE64_04075, partial [Ignavibacteriaceae bacterium]|nr:hypothetical protein [Ignavibacteriaceae bacterium]
MTEEIKEEEGINKKELHQILIEQDWRFARLLIGLSLGVILFSFEIFKNSHSVCYDWTLPTSRICLFVSFLFGLGYLFFYKKQLFAEAKKSPDWWRQVGAVLVKDGKVIF